MAVVSSIIAGAAMVAGLSMAQRSQQRAAYRQQRREERRQMNRVLAEANLRDPRRESAEIEVGVDQPRAGRGAPRSTVGRGAEVLGQQTASHVGGL